MGLAMDHSHWVMLKMVIMKDDMLFTTKQMEKTIVGLTQIISMMMKLLKSQIVLSMLWINTLQTSICGLLVMNSKRDGTTLELGTKDGLIQIGKNLLSKNSKRDGTKLDLGSKDSLIKIQKNLL